MIFLERADIIVIVYQTLLQIINKYDIIILHFQFKKYFLYKLIPKIIITYNYFSITYKQVDS